jgi:isoquinoline 1-oxidoreductase beta subunit
MNEVPDIEGKMIETDNKYSGVGELGLAMVTPSIANAIFNITGVRIRHMPLTPDVVRAALAT